MSFTKELLTEWLKKGVFEVTFSKKDGTVRVMEATLLASKLPVVENKTTTRTKKPNPEVLSVWSVKDNSWRSFRIDSVKSVRPIEEGQ